MKNFKIVHIKLAVYYVAIAMLVSIVFSSAIYKIASAELGSGLSRQAKTVREEFMLFPSPRPFSDLDVIRNEQLVHSKATLRNDLIFFNLIILIFASVGGYFLARRTLKPIEASILAQSRFTADASHELRTPLAAMRSEIEVALRDKNFSLSGAKSLLKSNIEEVERLEQLSTALLQLARIDDKGILLDKECEISEVVLNAYQKLEKQASEKQMIFDNKIETVKAYADEQSISELVVILLENAIKYSAPKTKISIKVYKKDKSAVIKVQDSGIGMKEADIGHIFDRFYRADLSRAKIKTFGYGLGLAIAKAIVEAHHGKISVSSKPGKGSIFTVVIPIGKISKRLLS